MSEIIQHRGLGGPDSKKKVTSPNSFEGFRTRFNTSIELDVFLVDDTPVVLHNKDHGLTQAEVEAMTLEEVEKITVADRSSGDSGHVPLFEEFAFNCLDRGNGLVIEIKASSPRIAKKLARTLVKKISEMSKEDKTFLRHPEYVQQLELHSFSIEALEEASGAMQEHDITLPLGLFWASTPENANEMEISATAIRRSGYQEGDSWIDAGIKTATRLGIDLIGFHFSTINAEVVRRVHESGLKISAWVVNDEEKVKELERIGVDKIITEN